MIFGVGSPLVVDFEESLRRAGVTVAAAVRNVPGDVWLLDPRPMIDVSDLRPDLLRLPFLVPFFTPANRQKAAREALATGFTEPAVLADPSVLKPTSMTLGRGVYINVGCVLGAGSTFGDHVLINRGACIGHHVTFDRFASIGPGAVVAGFARLGRGSVVGAGAVVLPKVTIGDNAVVGAGAVLTRDLPDHCLAVGNPARVAQTGILGYAGLSVD